MFKNLLNSTSIYGKSFMGSTVGLLKTSAGFGDLKINTSSTKDWR